MSLLLMAFWFMASPQEACAQGDQLVTMCFRGRTIQVPFYLAQRYAANGATYGPCPNRPFFTTQPQSQTRYVGGDVTFTSAAYASPAPTYQWRFNGGNLNGATNANYTITNVQISHAGNYTVTASNTVASEMSMVATLTVLTSAVTSLLVTTTNDAGAGSLRQVLFDAASVTNPVISFAAHVTNTIVLTNGEIAILKSVNIAGPGARVLGISGNNATRVFNILGGTNTISGLTIREGRLVGSIAFPEADGARQRGGGIMNEATLTLTRCVISNNAVEGGRGGDGPTFAGNGGNGSGGGLCTIGLLTATECSFLNNSSTGGEGGSDPGGINGMGGQGYGGGVYVYGTATFTRCTFSGNSATAGIGPAGVGGGNGGGIYNELDLTLLTCTVASNSANGSPFDFGGGICDNGVLTVRNSTVANNQADYGGGIYTGGANLGNTVVAGNSAPGDGPDGSGSFNSSDYNLVQNPNGVSFSGATTHNILGQNPLLGSLQDNGGPTFTMNLLPGSPAIDQGKSSGLSVDQRGMGRPWDFPSISNAGGGDGSDIGACEIQPANPQLNIRRASSNVVLSWPTEAAGFRLQSTANLSASNNWTVVGGTPAMIGNQLYVTNAATNGNKFYRLSFP